MPNRESSETRPAFLKQTELILESSRGDKVSKTIDGSFATLRKSVAVAAVLLLFSAAAICQGPATKVPPTKPPLEAKPSEAKPVARTPELTATDLETFLDGLMPLQIEQANIAGAVVAVVKNGKPLFAKGYGYSDYEKKIRVSPENTLFRPGSISKLFTWTCVMQLVEQGKLDLDRDVNDYF